MKKIITLLVAAVFATSALNAQELANFDFGGRKPIVSPEVQNDSVTFRLKADYATVVKLYTSWLGYQNIVDLTRGEGNVWSVTLPAPSPEIYTYNFIVDGTSVNDPSNVLVQRDGTRYLSMLLIDGELTENYKEANRRGTVTHMWYDSEILGLNRRLTVYTPYGYETNKKAKYPVLYLLHGGGGDEEAWTSMGRAAQILDNLIEKGLAKPMIVVMPNGNPDQQAAVTLNLPTSQLNYRDPANANAYVRSLCEEIVPFIEKNFRAIPKPESRAIAGLSMGGGHTISASTLYPQLFDYICPLSATGNMTVEQAQALKKAGVKLYWIGCGREDFLFEGSNRLDATLTEAGLEHTYYLNGGGHVWFNWRQYLNIFAQLLFK
ncbi:MAG: alpha/beta hydrolase-fold protein [Candidatus Cryptobacteroides sp.]|nr:alpha/beta hydrolase-fold protein [Rikenellaceae bacterium]MDY5747369.1 alpha/beta hydrolase-fold protein [Candidatus Cryptobacteroides sp.]